VNEMVGPYIAAFDPHLQIGDISILHSEEGNARQSPHRDYSFDKIIEWTNATDSCPIVGLLELQEGTKLCTYPHSQKEETTVEPQNVHVNDSIEVGDVILFNPFLVHSGNVFVLCYWQLRPLLSLHMSSYLVLTAKNGADCRRCTLRYGLS
jgi:hypothetical protein